MQWNWHCGFVKYTCQNKQNRRVERIHCVVYQSCWSSPVLRSCFSIGLLWISPFFSKTLLMQSSMFWKRYFLFQFWLDYISLHLVFVWLEVQFVVFIVTNASFFCHLSCIISASLSWSIWIHPVHASGLSVSMYILLEELIFFTSFVSVDWTLPLLSRIQCFKHVQKELKGHSLYIWDLSVVSQ